VAEPAPSPADAGPEAAEEAPVPDQPAASEPAAPRPVVVKDPLYPIEFRLPAPYWYYMDQAALAEQMKGGGGCAPPQQLPQNVLFVFGHRDAPAVGRLELGPRKAFLMRDKADLESYIDARMSLVTSQTGGILPDVKSEYGERDGMIFHRMDFEAPLKTRGGGCMSAPPPADQPEMRYVIVHYFVRPRDADVLSFMVFCYAQADVYEALEPELESILASVRYTGDVAAEFFEPNAPPEKLLTPEDAQAGQQKKSLLNTMMMPMLLVVVIWMMFRKKKPKAEAS
jgi:hypothetical protein